MIILRNILLWLVAAAAITAWFWLPRSTPRLPDHFAELPVAYSPGRPLELRLLADPKHDSKLVEIATRQQEGESRAKKRWSETVVAPDDPKQKMIGRWVEVDDQLWLRAGLFGDPMTVKRVLPESMTESAKDVIFQVLVVHDEFHITSHDVLWADSIQDQEGKTNVVVTLTDDGANRLERLTESRLSDQGSPARLGIVVNNKIHSADKLKAPIRDQVLLGGSLSPLQADRYATMLRPQRAGGPR